MRKQETPGASDVADIVADFVRLTEEWQGLFLSRPTKANKISNHIWELGLRLGLSNSGRRAVEGLAAHPNVAVRLKAATRCLAWAPDIGTVALEEIERGSGPEYMLLPPFAKIILIEFRAGRLALD